MDLENKKGFEKIDILYDDIEYLIIENEDSKKIIAKITQYDIECIKPYVIRVKPISIKKDKTEV